MGIFCVWVMQQAMKSRATQIHSLGGASGGCVPCNKKLVEILHGHAREQYLALSKA